MRPAVGRKRIHTVAKRQFGSGDPVGITADRCPEVGIHEAVAVQVVEAQGHFGRPSPAVRHDDRDDPRFVVAQTDLHAVPVFQHIQCHPFPLDLGLETARIKAGTELPGVQARCYDRRNQQGQEDEHFVSHENVLEKRGGSRR